MGNRRRISFQPTSNTLIACVYVVGANVNMDRPYTGLKFDFRIRMQSDTIVIRIVLCVERAAVVCRADAYIESVMPESVVGYFMYACAEGGVGGEGESPSLSGSALSALSGHLSFPPQMPSRRAHAQMKFLKCSSTYAHAIDP